MSNSSDSNNYKFPNVDVNKTEFIQKDYKNIIKKNLKQIQIIVDRIKSLNLHSEKHKKIFTSYVEYCTEQKFLQVDIDVADSFTQVFNKNVKFYDLYFFALAFYYLIEFFNNTNETFLDDLIKIHKSKSICKLYGIIEKKIKTDKQYSKKFSKSRDFMDKIAQGYPCDSFEDFDDFSDDDEYDYYEDENQDENQDENEDIRIDFDEYDEHDEYDSP